MDEIWKQVPCIAALLVIVAYFLRHLQRSEERHDMRVAAFIGAMETMVAKYGSVVRMVVTKDAKIDGDQGT